MAPAARSVAAPGAAPAASQAQQKQHDDRADDGADDAGRVRMADFEAVVDDQVLQVAAQEGPRRPRAMVPITPIGSRLGTSNRAMAPAIRPTMSRTIRNPSMLRQLPVSGAAMGRRRAASMLPRGRRRYPDKAGHPFWRARLRCATV